MEKIYDDILYSERVGDQVFYQTIPLTLSEFFSGRRPITIPDYQRPYSWDKNHVEDLLRDIQVIAREDDASWFIGSLFLLTSAAHTAPVKILDGQQRTTTIQLLALALYKQLIVRKEEGSAQSVNRLRRQLSALVVTDDLTAKFRPSEVVQAVFADLVESWVNCEEEDAFDSTEKKFKQECTRIWQRTGYKTPEVLQKNFRTISKWVEANLESFDELENYSNAFQKKIWLIQIPMQSDAETVKIFEALNNRGKPLSLVDKLRFRCLIVDNLTPDQSRRVKKKWGEIFLLLSKLEGSHIIKNEDDAFKIFFNAIDGEGRDKNEQFFDQFNKLFATEHSVVVFLDKVRTMLDFFVSINSPNDDSNFVLSHVAGPRKARAKALLHVLYSMIRCSANSRFLLAKAVYDSSSDSVGITKILDDCWQVVRTVVNQEVVERTPSNETRTDYLDMCKFDDSTTFSDRVKYAKHEVICTLKHVIFHEGTQQDRARFLLTLYAFAESPESLTTYESNEIRKSEVDHFIPRAWKNNWDHCGDVTKEDIINEFIALQPKFPALNVSNFIETLEQNDVPLSFQDYSRRPLTKAQQLLEFIGNRWLLSDRLNRSSSHGNFETKRDEYARVGHRIPADDDEVGISQYNPFEWRDICARSLHIVSKVKSQVEKSNWH